MSDCKTFTVHIDKTLFGGYGLTHHDGKALMVQSAVAGDHVTVRITKDAKRYRKAEIVTTHSSRPRVCSFSQECGGCPWDGISATEQQQWKQTFVAEALSRASLQHPEVPLPHVDDLHHVRHRVELQMQWDPQGLRCGYYAQGSREVTPIRNCLVTTTALQKTIESLVEYQPPKASSGHFRVHLQDIKGGVAVLIKNPPKGKRSQIPKTLRTYIKNIKSVTWVGTLADTQTILPWEDDLGLKWSTSPGLFQQVHKPLNHKLRRLVQTWVNDSQASKILDLCCGSGNLSLGLAQTDRHITGVEFSAQAIAVAKHQVKENHIPNMSYHSAPAEKWLAQHSSSDFDCIIVDPPRTGLKELIPHLRAVNPQTMIMISCDPPTLARDLSELGDAWSIQAIELFDFFPNTWHVETAILLTRS